MQERVADSYLGYYSYLLKGIILSSIHQKCKFTCYVCSLFGLSKEEDKHRTRELVLELEVESFDDLESSDT